MSNLSNDASLPEIPNDEIESTPSPKIMLTTMVLLIAGLFLTGFMMLHYAKQHNAPLSETLSGGQQSDFQAASTLFKKLSPAEQETAEATVSKEMKAADKSSVIDQLFKTRDDSTKWPKLKLTGFGTASDGSGGFAIINNHQYHEGQFISGTVRLMEVRKYDVVVELNGSTKTLTVDATD